MLPDGGPDPRAAFGHHPSEERTNVRAAESATLDAIGGTGDRA
jgi:hypothetical protein